MKIPDLNHVREFLASPPLWRGTRFGLTQFEFPKVDLNQFRPSPIPAKLRLGHYIEHVFLQLLHRSKKYEVLLHNLPIKNEVRTLGEIDFIIRDLISGQLAHIELTYKFYLMDTSITDPMLRWIGPNRKDRLIDKLEKIKNEQFKLLHSIEGTKELINNNIDISIVYHKTCFKAQLFVPFKFKNIELAPLNPDCVMGYWIRFDEFKKETFIPFQYYLPSKLEWLDKPHHHVTWADHSEVLSQVKKSLEGEYSPMLWVKKSESEFEKFFVVWWECS